MEIFLCDKCDTLAEVSLQGDTIKLKKCACLTLDWKE
jgi:hypothetical protein